MSFLSSSNPSAPSSLKVLRHLFPEAFILIMPKVSASKPHSSNISFVVFPLSCAAIIDV